MPLSFRDAFSKRSQAGGALLNAVGQQRSATARSSFLLLEKMRARRVGGACFASGHHLKVFGGDQRGVARGGVMFRPQADKLTAQGLLAAGIERCESARHGA